MDEMAKMGVHHLIESQSLSYLRPIIRENVNAKVMIGSAINSEMSTYSGLTHFCIRYTKTCQAIYPVPLSVFLNFPTVLIMSADFKNIEEFKKSSR